MPVHIKNSKDGQFFFVVQSCNGKTLVMSETYPKKSKAIKGALALINASGSILDKTVAK